MTLNEKIQAYLKQENIEYFLGAYVTGHAEDEEDKILHWDAKLGPQPTLEQLEVAWNSYVPPAPVPTKEQLMAELAALTAKIQALE